MNRRSLLLSAAGTGLAVSGLAAAPAQPRGVRRPTTSSRRELRAGSRAPARRLLRGATTAKLATGAAARDLSHGALSAPSTRRRWRHCSPTPARLPRSPRISSSRGLTGTFATQRAAAARTGLEIARPLLGVYLAAAIGVSIASYRTLLHHDGRQRRAAGRSALPALGRAAGGDLLPTRRRPRDRERRDRGLPWLETRRRGGRVLVAAAALLVGLTLSHRRRATERRPAQHLRRRLVDRGLPGLRQGAEVQLRRLQRARDTDQERRPSGHLRLCEPSQHAAAVRRRPRRQACDVHLQPARTDRPEVQRRGSNRSTT